LGALVTLVSLGAATTLGGCQWLAGISDRAADPLPEGCSLPRVGDGLLRVANLGRTPFSIDVCVRPTGGAYGRPALRGGGLTGVCASGLGYGEVSAPFAVPRGLIDVKLIKAGDTCSAPALAELSGVDARGAAGVTVARYLDANAAEAATARAESARAGAESVQKIRFGDFLAGSRSLQVGVVPDTKLPQAFQLAVIEDVPFGGFPAAHASSTLGAIDENGYFVLPTNRYHFGVAEAGSKDARFVAQIPRLPANHTVFAIGSTTDLAYPARGLVCDDGETTPDGMHTSCALTELSSLVCDVWNVGLYGAFAPEESARRPLIYQQIPSRPSDVMCLTSVSRKSDRDAIAKAAKAGGFLYSYAIDTNLDTPADDPADASGALPAKPTAPPCGGTVDPKLVDAAYRCMIDSCNELPGNPAGAIGGGTDCIATKCAAQLIPLLGGSPAEMGCFDCLIGYVVSYTPYGENQTSCTTDLRVPYAFHGEAPSLILSKHPLKLTESFVLPSWSWRRVALHAQLELEPGKAPIDYYCAQLTPILSQEPYVGPYSPYHDTRGWEDEQALEVSKLIAWIKRTSAGRPAVVSGDWESSIAFDGTDLVAQNPRVGDALAAAFALALPARQKPQCNYCSSAFNGDVSPQWLVRTYLLGFPDGATQSASRFFTDTPVPLSTGALGPLSDSFGFSVGLLRP
jgi:hypothetical protein